MKTAGHIQNSSRTALSLGWSGLLHQFGGAPLVPAGRFSGRHSGARVLRKIDQSILSLSE
jgi:hypothetical protein